MSALLLRLGHPTLLTRLDPLLREAQQIARSHRHVQIVSLTQAIRPLDPVCLLPQLAYPKQPQIYLSRRGRSAHNPLYQDFAVLAIGSAWTIHLPGPLRFQQAKGWIQQQLQHLQVVGDLDLPWAGPHWFGGFTFFDQTGIPAKVGGVDPEGKMSIPSGFPSAMLCLPQVQIAFQSGQAGITFNWVVGPGSDLEHMAGIPKRWETILNQAASGWMGSEVGPGILGHEQRDPQRQVTELRDRDLKSRDLSDTFRDLKDPNGLKTSELRDPEKPQNGRIKDPDQNGLSSDILTFSDQPLPTPRYGDVGKLKISVERAIRAIRSGLLDKVIVAHALDTQLPHPVALDQILQNLQRSYPDCLVFSINAGEGSTFMGASPERLLSVHQGHFWIDALAGSAPRGQTPAEDQVAAAALWSSQKDRDEHDFVIASIVAQLERLGVEAQISPQPQILQLSNIQHLQTLIEGDMPDPLHLLDLLAALHPTAAVAGMPKHLACEFIQAHEPFDRGLYAAPLGWIDYQGNGEFVVGIRSALIQGSQARLYAGAGIVADSDPDREVAEIQLKLQALWNALI